MSYRAAQDIASERNLDLVLVNKNGEVQVFKIMDHGKHKYEKKKNKQKQKKAQHQIKEMTFKMRIDPHDQEIKINRIKGFLSKGFDVKISVTMRGRERANPHLAREKMNSILEILKDDATSSQLSSSGNAVTTMIKPVKKTESAKEADNAVGNSNEQLNVDSNVRNQSEQSGRGNGLPVSTDSSSYAREPANA